MRFGLHPTDERDGVTTGHGDYGSALGVLVADDVDIG
jgi:hypothetical protein